MYDIDISGVQTPVTIIDLGALERNLEVLATVQEAADCKILLALKGFAMWSVFDLVGSYLHGVTASSPHEARLGREHMGKEVHAYAPAYSDREFREILTLCDHVVLNSPTQWQRFAPLMADHPQIEFGLRVNPEHREVAVELYDPCSPNSRLGTTRSQLEGVDLDGLNGLHFHTLCELGSEPLERTLRVVEEKFGYLFSQLRWINFGGGHHITASTYDRERLIGLVGDFRARTGLEVYLEPGEAIAIGTGILVATVLDIVHNGMDIAMLDISATAHMPDVLEMPYRPDIKDAGAPGERAHTYRLGGLTCLAGDVVGDYSFDAPLRVGDKLVFMDQAHYTTVKNSTFNGVRLPSIATWDPKARAVKVVREFGYQDYAGRLS